MGVKTDKGGEKWSGKRWYSSRYACSFSPCTPTCHTGASTKEGLEEGGREGGRSVGKAERKLCLPFLMVKYTDPLLRVALKSVANAVRKAVGLRTPMLDKRGVCCWLESCRRFVR